MAIGYARVEFVKRSRGKTSCAKSAYNSRSKVRFEGNCALEPATFDFSSKGSSAYSEILCPDWVNDNFKIPEVLWNAVEAKERKYNSQVAIDLVLALPDDRVLTLEDRIHLAKTFIESNFTHHGLGAQLDIHQPDRKIVFSQSNSELGVTAGCEGIVIDESDDLWKVRLQDGTETGREIDFNPKNHSGFVEKEHNWHAHVLITTRRFKENGLELEDKKARDLLPQVRRGHVIAGPDWGKLWTVHQNEFFQSKGLSLRVDSNGIVPQEHLGPVRLRGKAYSLLHENSRIQEANYELSKSPENILEKITDTKSVFSREDVERFLQKYVSPQDIEQVREEFWKQSQIHQLLDSLTGRHKDLFSTEKVIEEENHILRIADRINERPHKAYKLKKVNEVVTKGLTSEQSRAFDRAVTSKRLTCIQGFAGTGKSVLLKAIYDAYGDKNFKVRGLGPDSTTSEVLSTKGIMNSENVYKFLFAARHGNRNIDKGKEVWIIDEAGKLGNGPLLELLKLAEKKQAKLILSGDYAQLPSVERGGQFRAFCSRYGSDSLEHIQRQEKEEHRELAKRLAKGEVGYALQYLQHSGGITWAYDRSGAIEKLIETWTKTTEISSLESVTMIAHSNAEVKALNEMAREVRKGRGEIGNTEYYVETASGGIFVSQGDRIEFRKNDNILGVTNGLTGTLLDANEDRFTVSVEQSQKRSRIVSFDPKEYHAFQLGYASTYYRSQGKTVEKAFVLHSPQICKESFYVGLTRHVKDVQYFVPIQQAKYLSDLKNQVSREGWKSSTHDYITENQLNQEVESRKKLDTLKELQGSSHYIDRLKGRSQSFIQSLQKGIGNSVIKYKDRRPSKDFFDPTRFERNDQRAIVSEVTGESHTHIPLTREISDDSSIQTLRQAPITLGDEKALSSDQVTPRLKRNLVKDSCRSRADIESELKGSLDPLLSQLFPDGPSRRGYTDLRFGSKGSLRVVTKGESLGSFYDFEQDRGGGPLQLIEHRLGLDRKEAQRWADNFLGIEPQRTFVLSENALDMKQDAREKEWISLTPSNDRPAPSFDKIYRKKLHLSFDEVARHPYRNEQGELLYYVLRLKEKESPHKKLTLPLSYGQYSIDSTPRWDLKGYSQSGRKTLYNLDQLVDNPQKRVLVVEGEKTADKALEKFPDKNLVCVTWPGGASNFQKADWSPLFKREVIIWPDNDKAGFTAGRGIVEILKSVGAEGIFLMDSQKLFDKLPEKWDLADPWPKDIKPYDVFSVFPGTQQDRLMCDVLRIRRSNEIDLITEMRKRLLISIIEGRSLSKVIDELNTKSNFEDKQSLWREYVHTSIRQIEEAIRVGEGVANSSCSDDQKNLKASLSFQISAFYAQYERGPTNEEKQLLIDTNQQDMKKNYDSSLNPEVLGYCRDKKILEQSGILKSCLPGSIMSHKDSQLDTERHCKDVEHGFSSYTRNAKFSNSPEITLGNEHEM